MAYLPNGVQRALCDVSDIDQQITRQLVVFYIIQQFHIQQVNLGARTELTSTVLISLSYSCASACTTGTKKAVLTNKGACMSNTHLTTSSHFCGYSFNTASVKHYHKINQATAIFSSSRQVQEYIIVSNALNTTTT